MPKHRRESPLPGNTRAVLGVAALVIAAVGATASTEGAEVTAASAAIASPDQPRAVQVQRAYAKRRAQVVEASRSTDRSLLPRTDAAQARAAERDAQARARSLNRLDRAAAKRSDQIARERARQRRIARRNRWVAPVSGYDITATFGAGGSLWASDHTGLDFAVAEGAPVGATARGTVVSVGYDGSYGNKVVIRHPDGTRTWYCHLSAFSVRTGEQVNPGTRIGSVGSTGNSTGPHLHLEVRRRGKGPVDPYAYLKREGAL